MATSGLHELLSEILQLERVTFKASWNRWLSHPKLFEEGAIPDNWSPSSDWLLGEERRVAVSNFNAIVRRWQDVFSSRLLQGIDGVPDLLALSAGIRSRGNASRRAEILELNDLVFPLRQFLDESVTDISRLVVAIEAALRSPAVSIEWVGPLTMEEWAGIWRVSTKTLQNWLEAGTLIKDVSRPRGAIYFRKDSEKMTVEAFNEAARISRNRKPVGRTAET